MTNPTENTPADPAEIDRLRAHSTQLLGELKAAKAKVTSLQAQLATATEERDAARQEVRTLRLAPARTLLEHVALPGTADIVAKMLEQRGYTFDLEGDEIVVRDAEGNPATVIDPKSQKARAAKLDAADLTLLMTEEGKPESERHPLAQTFARFIVGSKASGGGAAGGSGTTAPAAPAKPATPVPARQSFGLS
ncbi:hypothetical protein [Pseudoxanthomonas koreensis]|uniref:hypothetical protein n=1 Tax=Pseudoxanthomonas koreensis TaxID=266061 RepID=UPI001390ED7A|nr:hypothetical protein [Pseudoxanthomonas koreensis]KAF1693391.1 hypothetical protein CSC64_05815 [Pseudoxanthomonas koreensis]